MPEISAPSPAPASGPAPLTSAIVHKHGIPAATLSKTAESIELRYLPEYLKAARPEIATSIPCTLEPIITRGGAVPPYFAGLLPEGRRLTALRNAIKTSADDEFGLLLAVGNDTIGDVTVRLERGGVDPDSSNTASQPDPVLNIPKDLSQVSITQLLEQAGVDRVGIPGVQDKASGRMLNLPAKRAGERLIVKLDPPEFPHVVRNEAVFLELAKQAGLTVPDWRLDTDAEGVELLCIRRFDRTGAGSSLAVEDASQVLGFWPADKYQPSGEQAALGLLAHCTARPVAARDLFEQIMFAVITGNGDQHTKNLSMLANEDQSEWRISPAYDLPSTVPYGDNTLALSLEGARKGVSRKKALAFAATLALPERAAIRSLDRLLDKTAEALGDVGKLGVPYPSHQLRTWQRELDYRRKILTE